jgi:hypothetical protein
VPVPSATVLVLHVKTCYCTANRPSFGQIHAARGVEAFEAEQIDMAP